MVDVQLAGRDIVDRRVLEAFRQVPRHMFVREALQQQAYGDSPLPTARGQTISQPYMVALMTQYLGLAGSGKVLEIGTGSGYQAAILAELAGQVYTVESDKELADQAREALLESGYANIRVKVGDGTLGWAQLGPYNGIMVTAGAPRVPPPLKKQLADDGRLVIPIGDRYSQVLTIVQRKGRQFTETSGCCCVFVPLIGEYGWPGKR